MTEPVTKRQAQVLGYISDFVAENGYAPTLEEISQHLGLSRRSFATAHKHVSTLARKGHLVRLRYRPRGMVLAQSRDGGALATCRDVGGTLVLLQMDAADAQAFKAGRTYRLVAEAM